MWESASITWKLWPEIRSVKSFWPGVASNVKGGAVGAGGPLAALSVSVNWSTEGFPGVWGDAGEAAWASASEAGSGAGFETFAAAGSVVV